MHAARLGYQGLELLETGTLTLPLREPERSRVMAIRTGERTFDEAVAEIEEVERRLAEALERTELPKEPDDDAVNAFLVSAYRRAWGWRTGERQDVRPRTAWHARSVRHACRS